LPLPVVGASPHGTDPQTAQTAGLLRYAREEQTTVGAVVSAATAAVLRERSPQLKGLDHCIYKTGNKPSS
jgi:hypothetical protein